MKIKAYAKINLSLAVLSKRTDGYHEIDSIMQAISLYDSIEINKSDKIEVRCSDDSISGEVNIAYKAAKLFFDTCSLQGGADIYIEKNIPSPAGLGGGSSDACAVLIALDRLYETNLSYEKLCEMAVKLGADVPFFIRGGIQRARGVGEILSPIDGQLNAYILIAINGTKPSTGEMYRAIDSCPHKLPDIEKSIDDIISGNTDNLAEDCENSFANVTGLYGIDTLLCDTKKLGIGLSGSGPAVFALYADIDSAKVAADILEKNCIEHYITMPVDCGIEFE